MDVEFGSAGAPSRQAVADNSVGCSSNFSAQFYSEYMYEVRGEVYSTGTCTFFLKTQLQQSWSTSYNCSSGPTIYFVNTLKVKPVVITVKLYCMLNTLGINSNDVRSILRCAVTLLEFKTRVKGFGLLEVKHSFSHSSTIL